MKKIGQTFAVLFVCLCIIAIVGCDEGKVPQQPEGNVKASSKSGVHEISGGEWLNSEPLTMEALKGKIVVLEFWATWCPPCRTSIPHLAKLYEEYKEKNVVLISFSNEPMNTVQPFAKQNGMVWPMVTASNLGASYEVRGIPHAIIVGKDGNLAWQGHPMQGLDEELKKLAGE